MWIRQLIERVKFDYRRLFESAEFFDENQKNELKSTFEKLVLLGENVQQRIYRDWWTVANDLQPKKLLQKPFLKENEEKKHVIDVFFDPQILIALNESLWWIRMRFEIPFSLNDVYNTRRTFRQMREEATGFIRKFNKLKKNKRFFFVFVGRIFHFLGRSNRSTSTKKIFSMNEFEQ